MTSKFIKLADICARLPYGLKVDIGGGTYTLDSICDDDGFHFNIMDGGQPTFWEGYTLDQIKPYLFPLSSMTEEQLFEVQEILGSDRIRIEPDKLHILSPTRNTLGYLELDAVFRWFNKNHIDYRGLISNGDALDATNLDIY